MLEVLSLCWNRDFLNYIEVNKMRIVVKPRNINEVQVIDELGKKILETIRKELEIQHKRGNSTLVSVKGRFSLWLTNYSFKVKHIKKSLNAYFVTYSDDTVEEYIVALSAFYKRPRYRGFPYEAVTQVLVWREETNKYSGFSYQIFWKHLIPKYHAIATDSIQTQAGKSVWEAVLDSGLRQGYDIYLIDTKTQQASKISTTEELEKLLEEKYGENSGYQRYLFALADPNFDNDNTD